MDIIKASNSNHVLTFRGTPLDHKIMREIVTINERDTVVDRLYIYGKQVCELLEYENPNQAIRNLVKDRHKKTLSELSKVELSNSSTFSLSYHDGKKIYVEEPGIWSLICRCTKPVADEFNDQLHLMLTEIRNGRALVVTQEMKALENSFSQLSITLEEEREQREEKERENERLQKELDEQKQYNIDLGEYIAETKPIPMTELIYIATTEIHMGKSYFKVGGTKSYDTLRGRLAQYQSGRARKEMEFYVDIFECHNYKSLETRIKEVLSPFKIEKDENREMFRLHYKHLYGMIKTMADNYGEEITLTNDQRDRMREDTIRLRGAVLMPLKVDEVVITRLCCGKTVKTTTVGAVETISDKALEDAFQDFLVQPDFKGTVVRKEFEDHLKTRLGLKDLRGKQQRLWTSTKELGSKVKPVPTFKYHSPPN
jgi:prophage antirepressor-like protein